MLGLSGFGGLTLGPNPARELLHFTGKTSLNLLWIGLLTWVAASYGSFWIRPGSPATSIYQGVSLADDRRYEEARAKFSSALKNLALASS